MPGKSDRKIILCKYIWSFSVYIYKHPPDAGVNLNWHKEKRPSILTRSNFFPKTIYIFLYYSLKQTKYQNINWTWRLGMVWVQVFSELCRVNENTSIKWVFIVNLIKYKWECSSKTIALLRTCSVTFTHWNCFSFIWKFWPCTLNLAGQETRKTKH